MSDETIAEAAREWVRCDLETRASDGLVGGGLDEPREALRALKGRVVLDALDRLAALERREAIYDGLGAALARAGDWMLDNHGDDREALDVVRQLLITALRADEELRMIDGKPLAYLGNTSTAEALRQQTGFTPRPPERRDEMARTE